MEQDTPTFNAPHSQTNFAASSAEEASRVRGSSLLAELPRVALVNELDYKREDLEKVVGMW